MRCHQPPQAPDPSASPLRVAGSAADPAVSARVDAVLAGDVADVEAEVASWGAALRPAGSSVSGRHAGGAVLAAYSVALLAARNDPARLSAALRRLRGRLTAGEGSVST